MKKIILNMTIGILTTALVNSYSEAQTATRSAYKENSVNPYSEERTDTEIYRNDDKPQRAAIKALKADLKTAKVNYRILNDFNRDYKEATGVSWFTEKNVIAGSFKLGELMSRIVYDKNGNRLYTVLNYYEDGLPRNISQMVQTKYPHLKVSLVQEIHQDGAWVYKIHLEDNTILKQILVCNEEMTEYLEFKKIP